MEFKALQVPPVTVELYHYLSRVFPKQEVKPTHTLAEIQYRAGQESVLLHLKNIIQRDTAGIDLDTEDIKQHTVIEQLDRKAAIAAQRVTWLERAMRGFVR